MQDMLPTIVFSLRYAHRLPDLYLSSMDLNDIGTFKVIRHINMTGAASSCSIYTMTICVFYKIKFFIL